jgi:hypothetical protein
MSDIFTLRPDATHTNILLYHDYICPWCWVGWHQAKRLAAEYGVVFDWRGTELVPPSMHYEPSAPKPVDPNELPKPPSRFDLFLEVEQIPLASPRPRFVRSHAALLGAEYALYEEGKEAAEAYHEAVYRGFWEAHINISDFDALCGLAEAAGLNGNALIDSVRAERYAENILEFDDPAYSKGIRHVPTFIFNGEEQLAEAYYSDLTHAVERYLVRIERFKGK